MTYRLIDFFLFLFSGNLIFLQHIRGTLLFMSDEKERQDISIMAGSDAHFHFHLEIQFVPNKSQLDVSSKSSKRDGKLL